VSGEIYAWGSFLAVEDRGRGGADAEEHGGREKRGRWRASRWGRGGAVSQAHSDRGTAVKCGTGRAWINCEISGGRGKGGWNRGQGGGRPPYPLKK
jgi:hypothetical protein